MKSKHINRKQRYLGFDDKWFMIIGILVLSFLSDFIISNSFGRGLHFSEAVVSWSIALFFSTVDWLITREILIFLRKKYPKLKDDIKRILLFSISIVITIIIVDFLGTKLLEYIIGVKFNPVGKARLLVPIIVISMMTMAIYEAIYFYTRLKTSIRKEEQSKQAIVQAQLDTLRNQAQPHFFFNTLNTLKDIIDQNSKEDATIFVDKLSDIYRFILESGNDNVISLRDEIKFAQSYVHIQSERFGSNLKLQWNIPDEYLNHKIIPMSIQLLIENAIKHNVVSKAKPLIINVSIKDEKLIVSNPIQLKSSQLPSTKLGLKNITKRYSLISDEGVEITENSEHFKVSLPLLNHVDQLIRNESIDN